MKDIELSSVQLGNCTDELATNKNIFSSKTTYNPLQTRHHHRATHPKRLFDRAIHPLWKTRMQVRRYFRPWSEILSVGQLPRSQTRTRICSTEIPRSRQGFSRQLSDGQTDLRRDLLYQSRTAATEREVVKNAHGYPAGLFYVDGDHGFCNLGSEYASGVAARSIGSNRHLGGER